MNLQDIKSNMTAYHFRDFKENNGVWLSDESVCLMKVKKPNHQLFHYHILAKVKIRLKDVTIVLIDGSRFYYDTKRNYVLHSFGSELKCDRMGAVKSLITTACTELRDENKIINYSDMKLTDKEKLIKGVLL